MGAKAKKSRLAGIPAWALSLIALFVSIVLFVFFEDIGQEGGSLEIIGAIFIYVFNAVACFFICKTHPKSVWYTPIICNAPSIVYAISPDFWIEPMSLLIGSGFVFSVIGAIVGARIGRRTMTSPE